MSPIHPEDPLIKTIAGLPAVEPNAQHVERVRGRCRAALERPATVIPVALEPATVGTICGLYAWQVLKIATRIPL